MPLYQLTLKAGRPGVNGGAGHRECFVTAADEEAARAAAAQCFADPEVSPWGDRAAVRCRPVRGLNRLPPPEGVVVVPDRFSFVGWRTIEIPAENQAAIPGEEATAPRWASADGHHWPVCD